MTITTGILDDQSILRYRELLDAEDAAFDNLEHAIEDGDSDNYDEDFRAWQAALNKKLSFLKRSGIQI